MSRYLYRMQATAEGYLARCLEIEVEAEGASRDAAVACLREAIHEKMTAVDGMAPPERPGAVNVELVEAPAEPTEPFGPGDPG